MFVVHVPISGISWKVTLNDRIYIWSVLCLSEEILLLGPPFLNFPLATYSWDSELNTFIVVYSSSNQSTSSAKAQYIILGLYPYNSPSKLRFFPSYSRRKSGVLIFKSYDHLFLWFTRVKTLIRVPCNCFWRFGAHDTSFNAPGDALFLASYGER